MIKHAYTLPPCATLIYYIQIGFSCIYKMLRILAVLKICCSKHLVNAQIKSVHATRIQSSSVCTQARRIPPKL